MFQADDRTNVFVKVYGSEDDREDTWIFADDLITFSKLTITKIEQIFNNAENIFLSEIREFNFDNKIHFIFLPFEIGLTKTLKRGCL